MRILITYANDASAHTARLIGDTLVLHGLESIVQPISAAGTDGFDAAVAVPALPPTSHPLEPDPGEVFGWAHQLAMALHAPQRSASQQPASTGPPPSTDQ